MPNHTVGLMGQQDRARWDAFVQRCPDATFSIVPAGSK
jgi:hypothetical protein